MSFRIFLSADDRSLFDQLNTLAATGEYDVAVLNRIKESSRQLSKVNAYYLASLYLHLNEEALADDILASMNTASREMKKFFHVLSYSLRNNLPHPRLTPLERKCIYYLDGVLKSDPTHHIAFLMRMGGFSLIGNAPGEPIAGQLNTCKYYFNSYYKNSRIKDSASVHVVTPSFNNEWVVQSDVLCITGNDIFYRRSRVWRKFLRDHRYSCIYTVPRTVWCSLYKELGASPSAGLLMLRYITAIADGNPQKLTGHVAGFSASQAIPDRQQASKAAGQPTADSSPRVNHTYDAEPASMRHNWDQEAIVFKRLIGDLDKSCSNLVVEI